MEPLILGIDPGRSGGLALVKPGWVLAERMGDTERDTYEWIRDSGATFAYIEGVHSMPGQGVASSFKFGMNYGFLRGVLIACQIPFETVSPAKWQRSMGCLSHGDKNVTKSKAQELFPLIKVTHGIADALLIAEYGYRVCNRK